MSRPLRLRVLAIVVGLFASFAVFAQGDFVISGRLKVDGGGLDGCRMVVYKDGEKFRTVSSDLNRFSMTLDLNSNYILSFEKNGFVTKKLSFNTHAPAQAGNFTPFDFVVSLFKQYDGVNTVVFNQPVGMIRYDDTKADFDYDTDYTKSIQSALAEAQDAVDKKRKEEEKDSAANAKQKERDARAQAKADARAAKDAEELVKQQAQALAEKKEAERKEEEQRLAVKPADPVPDPAPAALPPAPEKSTPKPPRPKPILAKATLPKPVEGEDLRRASEPRTGKERSPVEPAQVHVAVEPRPKFEASPVVPVRHQDVIVEANQVITVVRLEQGDVSTEYRKVVRKYSGVYYFKDGASCTKLIFEQEAMAENRW